MLNSNDLVKIREDVLKEYYEKYTVEEYLYNNAKEYLDNVSKIFAEKAKYDIESTEIICCGFGRMLTTENKEISKLFCNQVSSKESKNFKTEYIDEISNGEDPIFYFDYYEKKILYKNSLFKRSC